MTPTLRRQEKEMMLKDYQYRIEPTDKSFQPLYVKTLEGVKMVHRDYPSSKFVTTKLDSLIVLHQRIFLSNREWGNELMGLVARDCLNALKRDYPNDIHIVTIHEHGGWFLTYAFIDGYNDNMRVVDSANDAAQYDGPVSEFRQKYWPARHTILPEIRRG